MDALRDNEQQVMCPYNAAHYIRKGRMDVHLKKCRQAYQETQEIVICDFNASHRVPALELQYHHDTCPDRKALELHVFNEEKFAPQIVPALPPISVPVDDSWDDVEVPSYDPQKYCIENPILRRIDTESAATRRDFRIAERRRFNNFDPTKNGADSASSSQKVQTKKVANETKEREKWPSMPAFSQRGIEKPPEDVTKMMAKLSIIPKAAVIPKQKK